MRKIEFKELKLKDIKDEGEFYKQYLKTIQDNVNENEAFELPIKKYEIFYLNILEGKIILLNKEYIQKEENEEEQQIYYDYSIAYKIYNLLLDIYDGIEDEQNEFNELYKNERIEKNNEIKRLEKQDEELYKKELEKYNIIKNSQIYKRYLELKEENEKLKIQNNMLKQQKYDLELQNNNTGFFKKIINRFKNKRIS